MRNRILTITIIIAAAFMWPFSCSGQVNGTLPNNDSCDTVFIEDPSMDALIKQLTSDNQALTDANVSLTNSNMVLKETVNKADKDIADLTMEGNNLKNVIIERDETITGLNSILVSDGQKMAQMDIEIKDLQRDLTACLDRPIEEAEYITVDGKQYKVSDIEIILPKLRADTVFVSHSNDDKTNRKFFHHGSFDAPFPKDITFETKELCMITIEFPDSLGTYRTLDKFKVERIMDHENARTIYKFIN